MNKHRLKKVHRVIDTPSWYNVNKLKINLTDQVNVNYINNFTTAIHMTEINKSKTER